MIRILQCVNNMHRAGLETMLMNYYRNIDRSRIQFDFLMHRQEKSDYDDEILALGGRIYRAPRLYPQNYPAYFAYMKQFFRDHPEYKIVHSHIDSMSYLPLLAAKRAGVPVRITHSHSASIDKDMRYLMKQGFRFLLPSVATHFFACGEKAGQFLFRGKPYQMIPNAIDAAKFLFDLEIRTQKRAELGLDGTFVVGHVGRFCYPKNHEFLVDIFEKICQKDSNSVLMLVGTGEKEEKIREYVSQKNLSDSVLFMGNRSDVNELYQAMDVFVMPSLFEGVPLVGVEAQFSGLPCVFSSSVTREVFFTDRCKSVDLSRPVEEWAQMVLNQRLEQHRTADTANALYDVRNACGILAESYENLAVQQGMEFSCPIGTAIG